MKNPLLLIWRVALGAGVGMILGVFIGLSLFGSSTTDGSAPPRVHRARLAGRWNADVALGAVEGARGERLLPSQPVHLSPPEG